MKNYDELTNDLLKRRDCFVANQKKKRKIVTSFCCVCLIAFLGIGIWQGGIFSTTPPDRTIDDAIYPGIVDTFDDKNGEVPDNNKIVINTITGISADRMNIAIKADDFVEMSLEEMCEYYGVNYIPDVPDDIKPWPDQRSGIYKRNGGTGEVYWDTDILNYSNEDFTRTVHIEANKGSYVLKDYLFFKGTEEKSIINNHEVFIGLSENDFYYSEFMYKNVGFLIDAKGVTEDEFVAIIASIIK